MTVPDVRVCRRAGFRCDGRLGAERVSGCGLGARRNFTRAQAGGADVRRRSRTAAAGTGDG